MGRPSGVAGDRLARRLRTDVADVRVRLEEAALRSDALLAIGQPERAAAVLDEQQALLAELRETLSSSVAAAMVEAEAESVLAGSPDGTTLFGEPVAPEVPEPRRSGHSTASAFVSAVAALALLIVAAPTPPPDTLAAADRGDGPSRLDGASTVGSPDATGNDVAGADEPGAGPAELDIRRLFGARPTSSSGASDGTTGSGLSQLQALVDQFVATVVRAAGGLTPATLPILVEEALPVAPSAPAAEASDQPDHSEAEAPRDDRAAADPPASEERGPEPAADEPQPEEDGNEDGPRLELPSEGGNASVPGLASE